MSGGYIKTKYLLSLTFLLLICFFICSPALCEDQTHPSGEAVTQTETHSSGEEGTVEKDRTADLLDLLYRFICFAILATILGYFIKKARVSDSLSARSDEIRTRLEGLEKEKEGAEKRYKEMEGLVRDFESKKKEILDEYRQEGIAEKDRIIAEANERVNQLIAQSEASLEQEIWAARDLLKQEIAALAIGQAREIIQKEINEKDNDSLINEFIEKVRRTN